MRLILLLATCFCLTSFISSAHEMEFSNTKKVKVIHLQGSEKELLFENEKHFEELKRRWKLKKKARILIKNKGQHLHIQLFTKKLFGWKKVMNHHCITTNVEKVRHHVSMLMSHREYYIAETVVDHTCTHLKKIFLN